MTTIYTIGHSTHPIEKLLGLLDAHRIELLADVRSHPYSRFNPQFNRERLQRSLETAGIAYLDLGPELGARSEDPGCYENGKVQFDRLARTSAFQTGIERVIELACAGRRVALMCAEKDPLTCHRTILVCRHLAPRGIEVKHILADGGLETHDAALSRLLAELGLEQGDLFRPREELIEEAYRRQGERIAYVDKRMASG